MQGRDEAKPRLCGRRIAFFRSVCHLHRLQYDIDHMTSFLKLEFEPQASTIICFAPFETCVVVLDLKGGRVSAGLLLFLFLPSL